MDPLRVTLSLAGIVLIIVAAYYATWFVSVKASGQGRGKLRNKNINLIDRFAISKDKSFCIVEIAGKVYVVGMTNQSMTLIDTLEASAFAENREVSRETEMWQTVPGGRIAGQLTKKIASFLRNSMWRRPESSECGSEYRDKYGNKYRNKHGSVFGSENRSECGSGEGFADSMRKASEKGAAGQSGCTQAGEMVGSVVGGPACVSPEGKQ